MSNGMLGSHNAVVFHTFFNRQEYVCEELVREPCLEAKQTELDSIKPENYTNRQDNSLKPRLILIIVILQC